MIAYGTQLHFQCAFELRHVPGIADPWTTLAKSIRHWIEGAPRDCPPETNPAFYSAWFFNGGEWRTPRSHHYVRTACLVGDGSDREPQYWALRYEHNCTTPGRVWHIDLGVTRGPERAYRMSIIASHFLRSGFIGKEPDPPLPTAPRLVGWLLNTNGWEGYAGSERLRAVPQSLRQGEGEAFRRRLADPLRGCPIVVVSKEFNTGQSPLDAAKLARLLAGSASVYESESTALDKEMEWCLGRRFSCWNGMVRVYQPGMRFDSTGDAKRQRYFSCSQITQMGADAAIEMLVRGVARRAPQRLAGVAISIEDIAAIERERRITELKNAVTDQDRAEWVSLLEQTNVELEATNTQKDVQIGQLQTTIADAEDNISRLEYEKKTIIAKTVESEKTFTAMRSRADAILSLTELPDSMREVVDIVRLVHGNRIAFTDQGLKSASESDFDDVHDAWKCLWAMATTLHDLFFSGVRETNNIETAFLGTSGFRLAMTEGELTKDNSQLMKLRKDTFEGAEIDITPHVKLDRDTTRIYFCPMRQENSRLIVVGHIGHLKTAGTKRRKD